MAVQTTVSAPRVSATREIPLRWAKIAIAATILLNLIMLLAYQHYLAADFPFQDEIGYVYRLYELPQIGYFHYLFDRYQTFYMPTYFFVWYEFYKLTHLNIETVRYTGAIVSATVSFLLCIMLYRKAQRLDALTVLVIVLAPFVICSYNNWASYNQSIEAVMEPLVVGLVLALAWIADKAFSSADHHAPLHETVSWGVLGVIVWLVAVGIYAPPLVFLAAAIATRLMLRRRLDLSVVLIGLLAVAVPFLYTAAGQGFNQHFSASRSSLGWAEMGNAGYAALALIGNALYSPGKPEYQTITVLLGLLVLGGMIGCTVYTLRLPVGQRQRFFIPLALALYSVFVLLEIVGTRLHEPDVGFTPRYSMHLLTAPISLIFWFILAPVTVRWRRALGTGMLTVFIVGVGLADRAEVRQLPYSRTDLARVRAAMMSLHAQPNAAQQAEMYVNPPLLPFVYPDLQFMRAKHLAMYAGQETGTVAAPGPGGAALTVIGFGPESTRANVPFHVQPDGESAMWLRLNQATRGDVYVVINGTRLRAFHRDDIVTTKVPASMYGKPGHFPVYVVESNEAGAHIRSNEVTFVVLGHGVAGPSGNP